MNEDEPREDSIVTTVRLSRDQHDRLREIAAHEHRTIAGEIRRLIEQRILGYQEQAALQLGAAASQTRR